MAVLTLITGAGASTRLGPDEQGPPTMGGWAARLRDKLVKYVALLGLQGQVSPEEFEERLGRFLRFARSLPDVSAYPGAGIASPGDSDEAARAWFATAASTVAEVLDGLYGSLHELFARARINSFAAKNAYEPVLRLLQADRLYYATTNYDVAGEIALDELRRRPYSGVDETWSPGITQLLHFDDIIEYEPRRTPVLHLHGRVGWYYGEDNQVRVAGPDDPYRPDLGTPALLLPDPSKTYDDVVTTSIWKQFEMALSQSDRVLVLGHSLNDPSLMQALTGVPDQRLAVTIHAPLGASQDVWRGESDALLDRLGRGPHVIPMDFGPMPAADHQRMLQFTNGLDPAHGASSVVGPLSELQP